MKKKENFYISQFDYFVKKSLSNELKYYERSRKTRRAHVISFCDLGETEFNKIVSNDSYPSEQFQKVIASTKFDIVIHDELLYEALGKLKPDALDIILLKFWRNLTDREIGEILNMSQQKVNYRKNTALERLKNIVTEMMDHDERTKL